MMMHRRTTEGPEEGAHASVHFGDESRDLAALWLHATGFNGMTYKSMLAPLGERHRVAALDMRGHGLTSLPADPKTLKSWHVYRDDVIDFLEKESTGPVVLGGHSMGGCVSLLVAGKRPDLVAGLVLVDPVVLNPRFYFWLHVLPFVRQTNRMSRQAKRRRAEFASREAAYEAYHGKGAFKSWREPFLNDYLEDGVRETTNEKGESVVRLTCNPAWESATFSSQRNQPWGALKKIEKVQTPIVVFRPNIKPVMTNKVTNLMMAHYRELVLRERPGASHFHPMEVPYEVRDEMARQIAYLIDGYSPAEDGLLRRTLHGSQWDDYD
jgi:pimeloyl-ACP methyl ester carboxylesterase